MGFGWFSKGGGDGDKTLGKAQKLQGQGRWAEALSFYDEVLARQPDSEPAAAGAKKCREELVSWNLEEAEAYREVDPSRAREHARLAAELAGAHEELRRRAAAALGNLEESTARAADQTARAAPAAPPPREPLFQKSCACAAPCSEPCETEPLDEGIDVEDLAEFYLESCEPQVQEAFGRFHGAFRVGFVHLQRGELAEALPQLEQAAAENPGEPGAPYALGLLASVEGRLEAAAVYFEQALQLDGGFGPAVRHLAETLREIGALPKAREVLSEWASLHAEDAEARLLLALIRIEGGDPAGALEDAGAARRLLDDTDPRPALVVARAQRLVGDPQAALATLQGVLTRRPDALEALVDVGGLLLEQGGASAERAAEAFKKCYRLDAERGWWYLLRVAEAYHERGWTAEARDVLSRARDELPEDEQAVGLWEAVAGRVAG